MTWDQWISGGNWANDERASIPMLPANIRELVVLAVDPDAPSWRIAAVVGQDPVLAAQVLRMANTVGVTPGRPATTIEESVRRLGSQAVRNILLAGCLNTQMTDPGIYGAAGRQVVDHCLGTAVMAAKLSAGNPASGELFLAGLLHDVGKLLVLKLAHEYRVETGRRPAPEEVAETLRTRHPQLGGWLATRWSIPESITDSIVWHHEPAWAKQRYAAVIVYAANRLAHRYGFGGAERDLSALYEDKTMREAGVDQPRLADLDMCAPMLYEETRSAMPPRKPPVGASLSAV